MLTIQNLSISVEQKLILQDFSLTINLGTIHALMGPNGSGKSTLAYTLAGHPHYTVDAGDIIIDRQSILELSPDQRAQAGLFLAFQYPQAIEGVSVQNMLKVAYESVTNQPLKSVLAFRKQLRSTAASLDINQELLSRSINDGFSGGEKKRIEVLQLLTLKPKIAIIDEIDSGLDIDSIKSVAKGLKQAVTEHNTAIIIITHYQRILNHITPDQVHILKAGKLVQSGGPELVQRVEKSGYKSLSASH